MQNIWIDEKLTDYFTKDIQKTEKGHIINIKFKDPIMIQIIEDIAIRFNSNNLYIDIDTTEDISAFCCDGGNAIDMAITMVDNNIYIIAANDPANWEKLEKQKVICITGSNNGPDYFKHPYTFMPLIEDTDSNQ